MGVVTIWAIRATAQPAASLRGLFFRRSRHRYLRNWERSTRIRWVPGAALGYVARGCIRCVLAAGTRQHEAEIRDDLQAEWGPIPELGFVLSCASSSFFVVAVFLHFARIRSRVLNSLSRNAYGMYLVHYVFVVWLQYGLLNTPLFALAKAAIVFGVTLVLSWATSAALRRLPPGSLQRGAIAKGPMEQA